MDACNGCEACVAICPCNALEFPKSKDKGEKVPRLVVNQNLCVLCGACAKACPVNAIKVVRKEVSITKTKPIAWKKAFENLAVE